MKKFVLIVYVGLINAASAFAALPPAAQALYDSAYAQDPIMVQFALDSGAQVIATPDGNSFYLQWFPSGSTPNTTPVVVTLHGSNGYAFHEFFSWYSQAKKHGCGIIALQWYRPNRNIPLDYFPDDTLGSYLDSALTRINYPTVKALLHGFSRGAARSYAIIFNGIQKGRDFFCTTISNSGDADPNYPLYNAINAGTYGPNVFAGKHWNLFCGGQDMIVGCTKMTNTKTWLQSQGAIVDIFIQDPNLGHNGFQLQSSFAYKDSILNNYLLCYNGMISVPEKQIEEAVAVFPNPAGDFITVKGDEFLTYEIFNSLGENVMSGKIPASKNISITELPKGTYAVHVLSSSSKAACKTIIIN